MSRLFLFLICFSHSAIFCFEAPLIFYHIPKTGGMTVNFLLRQQFKQNEVCNDAFYYIIENRNVNYLRKYKLLMGHFFFCSNLRQLENSKKIVVLREPVSRILSEQRFYKVHYTDCLAKLCHEHFFPLGEPIDTISNQQCLYLSSWDRNDTSVTTEMHLASAKFNLENEFFCIGVTEQLSEFIEHLYKLMGWKMLDSVPKTGSLSHHELNISSSKLQEIKERNWADIELYNYAIYLIEKQRNRINLLP